MGSTSYTRERGGTPATYTLTSTERVQKYMRYLVHDNLANYPEDLLERDFLNLPAWRQEQATKYRHAEGRRNCILAYRLLCRALHEEYGIEDKPTFVIGEHGKPSLMEYPHIHFNMSHCSNAIMCAVSHRPIGVDIEWTGRKVKDTLIQYTMNETEQREIQASPQHRFLHLWTMKEALVKLQGTGLRGRIPDLLLPQNTHNITFITQENIDKGYVFSIAQYLDNYL